MGLPWINVDGILCFALIHHLLVNENMQLPAIRDLLHDITNKYLVLEFVPTDDEMFRKLMKFHVDDFSGVNLRRCRGIFVQCFRLLKEVPVPGSRAEHYCF